MTQSGLTWRFPRMFWTGNAAELCERAAYYGTFIALRTYLIRVVGLDAPRMLDQWWRMGTANSRREFERAVRWDDPDIGIDWPLPDGAEPILSPRDAAGTSFSDADTYP